MKLVQARPDHFDLLELRDHEANTMACDPLSGVAAKQLIENSICSTMLYKGQILCILGFYQLWPGVLNVWIFPSIYAAQHPMVFLRAAKKYTKGIADDIPCHRLQTLAIDDKLHSDWMTFLGFKKEGVLEKYTPDMVDYCQWAIVKKETL
jgi:hypothetical protein